MARVCKTGSFLPLCGNMLKMVRYTAKVAVNHYRKWHIDFDWNRWPWMTLKWSYSAFFSYVNKHGFDRCFGGSK